MNSCCTSKKQPSSCGCSPSISGKKENQQLPVAIIGGGPVGLAAAAHLMKKGERFVLFESGQQVGANIKKWGHVRLFSPWRYNIDKVAKELLTSQGWEVPDEEGLPTGNELVEKYLYPLSKLPAIRDHIHVGAKVVSVTRKGLSKIKTKGRESLPFVLQVEIGGETNRFEAKAVIDASGTWSNPNPSVSDGVWGKGELDAKSRIFYGIPNILGAEKNRYIGKNVVVVGGGHSAINVLLELRSLKQENPETNIFWVLRKNHVREVYGGQENDNLPARGELGIQIQGMVDAQEVSVLTPFFIEDFRMENGRLTVTGELNGESMEISNIDQVISNTGTRPELSFLHEVRINMDSVIESVAEIAPLIDPNIHSCGTVRPHGEKELRQPEKNFYIVGMKSYGRAPTFLLATGYEQVRSIVAGLTGDWDAAAKVELELPETGVCSIGLTNCCEGDDQTSQEKSSCSTGSCSTSDSTEEVIACCG